MPSRSAAAPSNTITGDLIASSAGTAVFLQSVTSTTISQTTMTAVGFLNIALYLNNASSSTIAQNIMSNPNGPAMRLESGSNANTISRSTMTGGSSAYALYLTGSSSNTITQIYLQQPVGLRRVPRLQRRRQRDQPEHVHRRRGSRRRRSLYQRRLLEHDHAELSLRAVGIRGVL